VSNQSVDCFLRSKYYSFCTEPSFRLKPSANCDCGDGLPCIFAYGSKCTVACEDSWGLTEITGQTVEVICACPSGICGNRALTDWELDETVENPETVYYHGDEASNGWMGIGVDTQSCVKVDCPDFFGCLTQPSGVALDRETCSTSNFYNSFAAGLGGILMLLISFTGLARRDKADDITLCLGYGKDFDETEIEDFDEALIEKKLREDWQNTKLRLEASVTVVLQVMDYVIDIWCALDYWGKGRHVVSCLTAIAILFQISVTTITKHPWTKDNCLVPFIFYVTGFGLVHENFLAWNLSESTLDQKRMVFIASLTEDVPSVAINISEIFSENYWPMLQSFSLLISMLLIL